MDLANHADLTIQANEIIRDNLLNGIFFRRLFEEVGGAFLHLFISFCVRMETSSIRNIVSICCAFFLKKTLTIDEIQKMITSHKEIMLADSLLHQNLPEGLLSQRIRIIRKLIFLLCHCPD